jgi:hypothetical protein
MKAIFFFWILRGKNASGEENLAFVRPLER